MLPDDNTAMKNLLFRALFCLLPIWALPACAAPQQDHAEIRATIEAFVRAQTSALPGQVSIKVDELDRRIARPACPALEAFLPPGGKLIGNSTLGVRCPNGKKTWSLFVPVHIKVTANLLISNKPMQIGQVVRTEDVSSQSGELVQIGVLTDPSQAVGKVLKYSIGTGQVLRLDMLRAPYSVKQGQVVQLQAKGEGFSVRSEGHALNNAEEGQIVQVRTPSGQVVSGIANSDGSVEMHP